MVMQMRRQIGGNKVAMAKLIILWWLAQNLRGVLPARIGWRRDMAAGMILLYDCAAPEKEVARMLRYGRAS
jgi:hypothetical protein